MQELVLANKSKILFSEATTIDALPKSVVQSMQMIGETVADYRDTVATLTAEIDELEIKKGLMQTAGIKTNAISNRITRTQKRVNVLRKAIAVLEKGYLPFPKVTELAWWNAVGRVSISPDTPTRALSAIADAKKSGLFDGLFVIQDKNADPYCVGVVSYANQMNHSQDLWFFVTGWTPKQQ